MVSQDNRLLPLPTVETTAVERPLDMNLSRGYGYSAAPAEVNVRDYLRVVLKRKWLILTLIVVVTSMVTIQMYRLPSIYQAATTIQIEPKKDNILKSGKEIVINTGNQQDPAYWQTQLKLLENPALARQVIKRLDLQHNPAFFNTQAQVGVFSSLRRIFAPQKTNSQQEASNASTTAIPTETDVQSELLTPEEQAKLEPYEDAIKAGLSVEPIVGTNLVILRYTHTDPAIAQEVANTMAEVFEYNNLTRENQGTKQAELLLGKKIGELQGKIKQEEETRTKFAIEHNVPVSQDPSANLTSIELRQYSTQLLDAQNDRKEKEAAYQSAASATDPYSVPEVAEDKRVQQLRAKLDLLKQKESELLVKYTKEWPEVKAVDEQIAQVNEDLKQAPKEIISSLKTKYESAKAREDKVKASYTSKNGESATQSIAGIQLGAMNAEIETDKQYLQVLLAKQNDVQNTTGSGEKNNVSVAEVARLPRAPIGPPRMRNIMVAFMLSLFAGIGLAFLLDYLDDTLKSVDDVDKYIRLPALALIPSRQERGRLKGKIGGQSSEPELNALALIEDVRSPVAEAYRHLRTSLLLSSAGQPPRSILVTSSQPSEGKTTTAVNTAVMLAQTGAEVVIIDCDLRRPRLHAHFNLGNSRGVTNFLSGECDLDATLQATERLPNLNVITSGPIPPNPAELLGSDEMRRLIALLGERFNHVIVDSPPAISFTDASILSTMLDGVMLVVHGGRSSRAVVRRAKQQLLDVGAHIFGVVLNNVKMESSDYYYYPGYYASYYSGGDSQGEDDAATDSVNG